MELKHNLYGCSGKIKVGKDLVGEMIQYMGDNLTKNPTYENFENYIKPHKYRVSRVHKYEIKKCADKLKDCVCLILGCTREHLEDRYFKETELGEEWWLYADGEYQVPYVGGDLKYLDGYNTIIFKYTPRSLLQLLGTEGGRQVIHPNIWVNALFADYKGKPIMSADSFDQTVYSGNLPNWIITDIRFPENEGKAVSSRDGLLIGVTRLFNLRFPEYTALVNLEDAYAIPPDLKDVNPDLYKSLTHESETSMGDHSWCDVIIENNGTIEELFNKVLKAVKL